MVLFSFARVGIACCIGLVALALPAVSAAQNRDPLSREQRQIVTKYLAGPDGLPLQKDEGYYFLDPGPSRKAFVTCLMNETCGKEKRIAPLIDEENFNMSLKDWNRLNLTFGTAVAVAKTNRLVAQMGSSEDSLVREKRLRADIQDKIIGYVGEYSNTHSVAGCLDAIAADRRNHAPERLETPLMRAVIACAMLVEGNLYLVYATNVWYGVEEILKKRGMSRADQLRTRDRWGAMIEKGVKEWTVIK